MALIDQVHQALLAFGVKAVASVDSHGDTVVVLEPPEGVGLAPELTVICPRGSSNIFFRGRCPLEIPRDRYWDALAYVNASVTDTSFARMYLDDTHLCFTGLLMADAGGPPANTGMIGMVFMMEASTLSMATPYVVDSLMKPEEAVKHAMNMMRTQARDALA
jgi:hypothetical protein